MNSPAVNNPMAGPHAWDLVAQNYAVDRVPFFEPFSLKALRLAELPAHAHIADVAAGPGTLSLLAAQKSMTVSALDVSENMIVELKRRAMEKGLLSSIDARSGDGQNLPWEDNAFDGAFSMFGLIFFPDRNAGFRELLRVLKPGRRAVVSSWKPIDGPVALVNETIRTFLPDLPFGKGRAPLGDPEELCTEMSHAGFKDVVVHSFQHSDVSPSLAAFWESTQRAVASLLLREKLGEEKWAEISLLVYAKLKETLGEGPVEAVGLANLGVGMK